MKNRLILTSVLSAFALAGTANAVGLSGSGTLGVTAEVTGSINLTFVTNTSGIAVTGTGSSTASFDFGSVSKYGGTVPSNVTKTVNSTSFDLATPFNVKVEQANSSLSTYTLTATLATADVVNVWTLGATDISDAAGHALTAAGEFGASVPYTLKLTVPASEAAGSISNTINFTAVGA
jgi:hypothetical protein